jgi:hypothetical protein
MLSWFLGTYWFPRDIFELTLDSRPASPGTIDPSRNRSPPIELSPNELGSATVPRTARFDRNGTSLQIMQSGGSPIDSLSGAAKGAGPYRSGAHSALLLCQHLELDHTLHRVLPALTLQGLGAADDGEDQPTQTHERQQPAEDVKAGHTAQYGDQHERDR